MEIRKALDILARAKMAYSKKKDVECLGSLIMVLKGLGDGPYPGEVAGLMRELLLLVGKDKVCTDVLGKELVYQAGQEKSIMVALAKVYKVAKEAQDREDKNVVRARKLKLDHTFNEGMRLLKLKEFTDADRWFSEALTHYKDEHIIYALIGDAFMKENAPKRAFPYLAKGIMANPNDIRMKMLYEQCVQIKDQK